MANKVELQFLTNAKQIRGELYQVNAYLHNIQDSLDRMNAKAVSGHKKHGSAMKGLALRFVGYNLILNKVMNAQQQLIEYTKESVAKFREFETRVAEVSTIMTGDFEPALKGMEAGIVSLSLAYGKGTSDLTKGLYDIMSAAFSAKDAINLLNTATKAAIAGLSDVRTSVDIFTTVLNTYGMSVYEATKVSDTLFQSVVRGKFQFNELESALGYVVPIAAQAGIEFEELMAALSTATRHGLHLDMASRGLAMALQNIINPSEGAAKAAKKYGIEMSGLALRIKGISGVFGDMLQKTKEYGKIVLNELIPNIRSLRVAMVLAGEEGMEGLLDDMDRLSVSAGRTEEALNKIKNTSQFVSNQISQHWEQTQREVGQAWDEFALGAQRTITDIMPVLLDWQSYIPVWGWMKAAEKGVENLKDQMWKEQKMAEFTGIERLRGRENREKYGTAEWKITQLTDEQIMGNYLKLQQEIAKTGERYVNALAVGAQNAGKLKFQLESLQEISATLQDDFNRVFGEPIMGGMRNLEELKLTLEEIEFNMEELDEHLNKPIAYGWGSMGGEVKGSLNMQMALLKSEQDLADAKYDVKMGTIMEDYEFKVLNADMQEAIRIIREHEAVTKKDTEAINLMNVELRKIQIEMMELQLVGMMKRRGLSRQEERRMKKLQIAAAKLRLENMKNTKAETASEYLAYEQAKQMIEEHLASKEHETYMLKYNYDQQVADLQSTIDYEQGLLKEREEQWIDTTNEIISASSHLVSALKQIFSDSNLVTAFNTMDINIQEMLESAQQAQFTAQQSINQSSGRQSMIDMLERINSLPGMEGRFTWMINNLKSFRGGSEYVHETGPAWLHAGERVVAAGKEGEGGTQIGTVNIQVQQIANISDIEKLGAVLSVARNARIVDRQGKSKYRIR